MAPFGDSPDVGVRVALASADPLAREHLRRAVEAELGAGLVEVAGAVADLRGPADVTIWDLGLGSDVLYEGASALFPEGSVLALVDDAPGAAEALRLGARGAVERSADGPVLLAAVRAVATGLIVLGPALQAALALPRVSHTEGELTPREREVLSLLGTGLPNKLIAERLGITERTAKFHVNSVLQKLDAQTRTEAVVKAARVGLLTL